MDRTQQATVTLETFCRAVKDRCEELCRDPRPGMAALSLYAFGGLTVIAEQQSLDSAEQRDVYGAVLRSFFGFVGPFDGAGRARLETCFRHVSDPASNFYPIIARGADCFRAWGEQQQSFDASDFREFMSKPPWCEYVPSA